MPRIWRRSSSTCDRFRPFATRCRRRSSIFPLSLIVKTIPQPLESHTPAPARTTAEARGEYIVRSFASSGMSHPQRPGPAAARSGVLAAAGRSPISASPATRPAGVQREHHARPLGPRALRRGDVHSDAAERTNPGTRAQPRHAVRVRLKNMTDDDLRDVWAYLKSRPPVKHRVSNTDPPTGLPGLQADRPRGHERQAGRPAVAATHQLTG